MGCLYKLTSPTGKSYIGISSKTMNDRWDKHVEHAMGKREAGALYAALRKYGPENFTKEVLAEEGDWNILCEMEVTAIKVHGTLSPGGYNMTVGGEGTPGWVPSDEARANISAAQKKRFERSEEVEKQRERSNRIRQSPEFREKSRKAIAAAMARPEVRAKLSIAAKAQFASEEARQAASKRTKKSLANPEVRQRMSDAQKRGMTQERRERISASVQEAMARPQVREKIAACAKARADDPEWRKKISASKKGKSNGPCSEHRRRLIAEARRREWADPILRAKRVAAFAAARAVKKAKRMEVASSDCGPLFDKVEVVA